MPIATLEANGLEPNRPLEVVRRELTSLNRLLSALDVIIELAGHHKKSVVYL